MSPVVLRRQVTVVETLTNPGGHPSSGQPKTWAAPRMVTVAGYDTEDLSRVPASRADPSDLVFTTPEDHPVRPTSFRRRFWSPAVDEAHLSPLRLHDLRHTAVAPWIAAGANPKQIAVENVRPG